VILAGDVGATKTLLGLFAHSRGGLRAVREASFRSADHGSLEEIVLEFMKGGRERIHALAVGVAGPVVDGKSAVVNLRWPVEARGLARCSGMDTVHVINDVEATAWGIPALGSRQTVSLTPRLRSRPGNAALIAAGSGLGTAILFWDGLRHRPAAGEGGHVGFAPRDDVEIELLKHLQEEHDRVSVERVTSGPGLTAIYRFLVGTGRVRAGRVMNRLVDEASDPAAAIAHAGLDGADPAARRALDRFVSFYGAAAGDLALVARAVGGVWVGGGIAPKILQALRSGEFLRAFRDKGRLASFVQKIPVRVILEPRTALIGAAAYAANSKKTKGKG